MSQIVKKHYPTISNELLNKAMGLFYQLRDLNLERSPATRELLSWLKYLKAFDQKKAFDMINQLDGIGVLIKTKKDLERIARRFSK